MSKYLITGGNKLSGTVHISGNKNSILKCIAAALLTDEEVTLNNVPAIGDVDVLIEIIQSLGVEVYKQQSSVKINAHNLTSYSLPKQQVDRLRASIVLVGPLLARLGKVEFSHPGGDIIGKRSIDIHLEGLKALGFEFESSDRDYRGYKSDSPAKQQFFLEESSVTATENLIMAATLGNHTIRLKHCALEPHVIDLCKMLVQMGAKIDGIGNPSLTITGVEKLAGTEFTIGKDFIEIGTYTVASAITSGEINLENCNLIDLEPILIPLKKMGIELEQVGESAIKVYSTNLLKSIPKLKTNVWPGFPTDLMSVLIVLATQAQGVSLLHDWMYESRMFFVDKLISMGANITIADPHRVLVYGPTQLIGRELETPDIRAGMALILAALVAKGESVINRAELIDRGYEDVMGKLSSIGAQITRLD